MPLLRPPVVSNSTSSAAGKAPEARKRKGAPAQKVGKSSASTSKLQSPPPSPGTSLGEKSSSAPVKNKKTARSVEERGQKKRTCHQLSMSIKSKMIDSYHTMYHLI